MCIRDSFLAFYAALAAGQPPHTALDEAKKPYPELASYRCFAA